MRRKVRCVTLNSHPELFNKHEKLRKMIKRDLGIEATNAQATKMLAGFIKLPKKLRKNLEVLKR